MGVDGSEDRESIVRRRTVSPKNLLKRLFARTPYRIVRACPLNRFQAILESLASLKSRGFRPGVIVDGGANVGEFAVAMLHMFPEAQVYMIEPQPGCLPLLKAIVASSRTRAHLHAVALSSPGQDGGTLLMATNEDSTSTGAAVSLTPVGSEKTVISVSAKSLDSLLGPLLGSEQRVFLKFDLQGFELEALKGARALLTQVDVALVEVSFYAQTSEPPISEIVAYLAAAGLELHDVAALFARRRDNRARQGDFLFVRTGSQLDLDRDWS